MTLQRFGKSDGSTAEYLTRVEASLGTLAPETRAEVMESARARVDLTLELAGATDDPSRSLLILERELGSPERLAGQLRLSVPVAEQLPTAGNFLKTCRCCKREVPPAAAVCPHCLVRVSTSGISGGGGGFEYRSPTTIRGIPLVHVAWGRDAQGRHRVAKGIIAVGRFAIGVVAVGQAAAGVITIAQAGAGLLFCLGQLATGGLAVGQIAIGAVAIGQIALGLAFAAGQVAVGYAAKGMTAVSLGKLFGP